jgi:hypothetical protein
MNWKPKVISKEVRKIPKGITTLYGIQWHYDLGGFANIVYSKTISNSGKTSIYAGYACHWKERKYKHYTDVNSNGLSKSIYDEIENAIKLYES